MLTRALLFVLHILHYRLLFLRQTSLFLSLLPPLSLFLSLLYDSFRLNLSSSLTPASRPLQHAYQSTLSLSRSRRSLPSHLLAFPHPCGTSRKLYVPTLATLNAGLARDNPRPSPPPSTAAATPRVALPSFYPSLPPHLPPFLFSPMVLPDSQPANQHASRLNPRST